MSTTHTHPIAPCVACGMDDEDCTTATRPCCEFCEEGDTHMDAGPSGTVTTFVTPVGTMLVLA